MLSYFPARAARPDIAAVGSVSADPLPGRVAPAAVSAIPWVIPVAGTDFATLSLLETFAAFIAASGCSDSRDCGTLRVIYGAETALAGGHRRYAVAHVRG